MMFDAAYIPDGYTLDGYIKAVPGLHPAVSFKYRPLPPDDRDALKELIREQSSAEYNPVIRLMLSQHVKEWDITNPGNGNAKVPITIDTLKTVRGPVFDKLYFIVVGDRASDIPEDAKGKKAADLTTRFKANAAGESTEANALGN